jgi:hypothetical protein
MFERRNLISLALLGTAWLLYAASLVLPAAEVHPGDGKPTGELAPGFMVLFILLVPFMWIFVLPFIYLLVNAAFWISPVWWLVRLNRGQIAYTWGLVLGGCTVLAWVAPFIVTTVGPGCIVWSFSITFAAAAFVVPMPRERDGTELDIIEGPEPRSSVPPKVVVREPLPERLPAFETGSGVVVPDADSPQRAPGSDASQLSRSTPADAYSRV